MKNAERFLALFSGFSKRHGYYGDLTEEEPNGKKKASPDAINTRQGGASSDLWEQHLRGDKGLGIIPLRDDHTVKFVAIDIDEYSKDPDKFAKMEAKIKEYKLPLVLCRSKSGGIHAYLFLKDPLPAKYVQDKVRAWMATMGVSVSEFFPKQLERLETKDSKKDSIGNWINMPYFGVLKGDVQRTAYKDGNFLNMGEFLDYAESQQQTFEQLERIVLSLSDYIKDGPVCQQILMTEGFAPGYRNNTLVDIAIYLKAKYPRTWKEELFEYNKLLAKAGGCDPLDLAEVNTITQNVEKHDYHYRCSQDPFKSRCNRQECMGREFGIQSTNGAISVLLEDMVILKDPNGGDAALFLSVNGKRLRLDRLEDLMEQNKFQKICVSEIQILPSTLKKPTWEKHIQELLKSVKVEYMPEEASPEGQFYLIFQDFLENRSKRTDSIEWILTGQVFLEEIDDKLWALFKSNHFLDYLSRKGFRAFTNNKIWGLLRAKGCETKQHSIKGKNVHVWRVPAENFQNVEFEVPSFDKPY